VRRTLPAAIAAAGAALLVAGAVMAQERIVAVVHPRNPVTRISQADVRNMFLGREKFWSDGTPVQPYVRPETSDAGRLLLRQVLRMTPARFRHHWQGLQLSGRGTAPPNVSSGRRAIAQVAAARGGISILTESEARAAGSHVKVVEIR
jgi:ABC-type phosphate transport system substrate-binding protein